MTKASKKFFVSVPIESMLMLSAPIAMEKSEKSETCKMLLDSPATLGTSRVRKASAITIMLRMIKYAQNT